MLSSLLYHLLGGLALVFMTALGCLLAHFLLWLRHLWQLRCLHKRHVAIIAHLKANPQYPFNLPAVETWAAGEYICEHCGRNNYFSLMKIAPQQLPPGSFRDSAEAEQVRYVSQDEGGCHGVSSVGGVYAAPMVMQCQYCHGLVTNAEVAHMMQRRQQEGNDAQG